MRFIEFWKNGCREPVGGRRELVSHHGATGGGVRGPKMRHLVLYKLAGFFPTDWQPCSGGLCPQKRGHFCGGEGGLFGRPILGGFGGRAGARGRARGTLFVSRFSPQKNAQPHRTVF